MEKKNHTRKHDAGTNVCSQADGLQVFFGKLHTPSSAELETSCWIVSDSGFGVPGCFRFRFDWASCDDVEEKKKHFEQ